MKEAIKRTLINVNFSERYITICNKFTDFNNRKNFKKKELQEILTRMNSDLKYSSRESIFLKDYKFGNITVRIIVPFKSGLIDCTYAIWTEGFKERVNDSFFGIATIEKPDIESKVQGYKFPIATSVDELEIILKEIIELHNNFIDEYSKLLYIEEEE